jgi:hypothetical protein
MAADLDRIVVVKAEQPADVDDPESVVGRWRERQREVP